MGAGDRGETVGRRKRSMQEVSALWQQRCSTVPERQGRVAWLGERRGGITPIMQPGNEARKGHTGMTLHCWAEMRQGVKWFAVGARQAYSLRQGHARTYGRNVAVPSCRGGS